MTDRLPPHDLEAEQSVIGGILIDNQMFFRVVDIVKEDYFYRPANGKIFSCMCELAEKGEPIDTVTLTAKLKEKGAFEEIGGASYLAELLEKVPTAINCEYHAQLVANHALKRNLVSICSEIGRRGMDPTETPEELLDYAESEVFSISYYKRKKNLSPVKEIIRTAFSELEKRFDSQDSLTGVPSGYIDLDKITCGFQKSDLIVVACRPSIGKTSFALGVTRYAAINAKVPIAFFSLEMSKEQIVTRLLSAEAKVDQTRLRTGRLTDQDWSRLTRAAGMLSDARIYVDDTPSISVLELKGKSRRLKSELGGLGLIVVDYLQIMGSPRTYQSRENAISDISRGLKALAKELEVPVLALSQLNRNVDLRQDKRPMLADLRESGAIEQDADLIIFIHRDPEEIMPSNNPSPAEFIIGKNRNGPRGTVKVAWVGQYASFENLAMESQYSS